ncbi:hypothetical protein PHYSODRAFT_432348, partial [Phytophthora sojae]
TLKIVTLVLRTATNADAQHVGSLITSFLLPTPNLSLTRAISFNSIELLDSIWDASCTSVEERSPSWTLINYLRSDPCYYRWQFAEAMNAAISCNNLRIVEWLWTHFSWCVVPARAIKLAASQGCLDILKFLQAHDAGYLETGNVVEWSSYAIQCSFRHLDIALWLYEHVPFYKGSKSLLELIGHILDAGDIERAESLLPAGKNIFYYARFCSRPEVVECMLGRGYYSSNEQRTASLLLPSLAAKGRLDLLQRVVDLYPAPQTDLYNWREQWWRAMEEACRCSHLAILRVLLNLPTGCIICGNRPYMYRVCDLLRKAGYTGNVEVMEFIYQHEA